MIIEPTTNSAIITSNIPGAGKQKMGFDATDPEAMELLLSMLSSRLYNDPSTAVIREYYTNAVDAHIKAGIDLPVEVTLPTWADPTYTVKDFGVGMSTEQIEKNFAQFLASTKRASIFEMGAFGLGSKAGFALTSQFSLVSVQDGVKTSALFTMVSDGSFDYDIIASVPTEEPNGTVVKIPIEKDLYGFNEKARKFFSFSESGKVVLDGYPVVTVWDTYTKVDVDADFEAYISPGGWGSSYLVMGTVPYLISDEEMHNALERISAEEIGTKFNKMPKIFIVPVGAVHLTPNREGLRYTEKTTGIVDSCVTAVIESLAKIVEEEMESAETLEDILKVADEWNDSVPEHLIRYNGKKVPRSIETSHPVRTISRVYGTNRHSEDYDIMLKQAKNVLVLTGEPASKYRSISAYFNDYLKMENTRDIVFMITEDDTVQDNEWISMSDRFSFMTTEEFKNSVRSWRKENAAPTSRTSRGKGSGNARGGKIKYPILDVETSKIEWVEYPDIPSGIGFLWASEFSEYSNFYQFSGNIHNAIGMDQYVDVNFRRYFKYAFPGEKILILGQSRKLESLKSRVKRVRNLKTKIIKASDKLTKLSKDPDVIKYHTLSNSKYFELINRVKSLELNVNLVDPMMKITVAGSKAKDKLDKVRYLEGFNIFFRCSENFGVFHNISKSDKIISELNNKYPLLSGFTLYNADYNVVLHAVKYMNMTHRESKRLDR